MDETEEQRHAVLEYASQEKQAKRSQVDPIVAVILCLPGLICLGLFLGLVDRLLLEFLPIPRRFRHQVDLPLMLILWTFAVLTALVSMSNYGSRPERRRWYVWLNLLINGLGLVYL